MTPESAGTVLCERVGVAHARLLADLHEETFPDGPRWSAADFAGLLAQAGTLGLLTREAAAPAGFTLLQGAGPEADLVLIAVRPAARRSGVGRCLIEAALDFITEAGARTIFLEVAEDNASALAFYAALGFAEVGRRPDYYRRAPKAGSGAKSVETRRTDAILMSRSTN